MCVVFVRCVHEHETCGLLRVIGREHSDVETRDRFPDEHDWSGDAATREKFGQLIGNAACGSRRRPGIAVTHTCPVVGAHTGESSNVWLDEAPASTRAPETR